MVGYDTPASGRAGSSAVVDGEGADVGDAVGEAVGEPDGLGLGSVDGEGSGLPDGLGLGDSSTVSVNASCVQELTSSAAAGSLVGSVGATASCLN